MAGGWARDGAVSEQIEASISDELARMQAQKRPQGESPPIVPNARNLSRKSVASRCRE